MSDKDLIEELRRTKDELTGSMSYSRNLAASLVELGKQLEADLAVAEEVRVEAESQGLEFVKRGHAWAFRNRRAERAEAEVKRLKEAWSVYVRNMDSVSCPEHGEEQVYGPCRSCLDRMNKAFEDGTEAVE